MFLLTYSSFSFSQDYKKALGIKTGYPGFAALNGKFYIGEVFALDNSLGINIDVDNRYVLLQSLFEYNKQIGLINTGYNWYVGLGPNLQYYTKGGYITDDFVEHNGFFLRADAILGIEVTPQTSRFNAAIEAGPTVNVYPITKIGVTVNVAVRYAFKQRSN